jgi:hypothetical protein
MGAALFLAHFHRGVAVLATQILFFGTGNIFQLGGVKHKV